MKEIEASSSLSQVNIFELFKQQLKKDVESSGCKADFIEDLPFGYELIKAVLTKQIAGIGKKTPSLLPILLYRIDISEAMLKKYQTKNPDSDFEEVVAEVMIKRVLQKVILKKTFSKK